MSVLIEALSLVIPRRVLDVNYPGGTDAYLADALAADVQFRYAVADDRLAVMSCLDPDALEPWVTRLCSHGIDCDGSETSDMSFVDQRFGPTLPCAWLEWRRHPDGFTYAWLAGTKSGDMVAPENWTPEQSSRLVRFDIRDEPGRTLRLGEDEGKETWLDFKTGRVVSGLPHLHSVEAHTQSTTQTLDAFRTMTDDAAPILPIVMAALDARRLKYLALDENALSLQLRTDHATYACRINVDGGMRTLACYAGLGSRVTQERRLAVAEAISRANYGLVVGCFELDMRDGEIRFRVSVDLEGAVLTVPMFDAMLMAAVSIPDRYYGALMRVVHASANPEKAIAEVEEG